MTTLKRRRQTAATSKKWRQTHREQAREHIHRQHREQRAYLGQQKAKPCADCGHQYASWVMDFDHVRGVKLFTVSQMMGQTLDNINTEIAKCDIVCANCHRERTHARRLSQV